MEKTKKTFGILGIVMGVLGFFISFIPILNILLAFISLLAIIFGIISLTKEKTKILGIISIILFIISVCNTILTYYDNSVALVDGKEVSYNEVIKTLDENPVAFEEKYQGKEIELTGTFKSVNTNIGTKTLEGNMLYEDEIILKEGWRIKVPTGAYDLSNLKGGDKLYVKSKISYGLNYIYLSDYSIMYKSREVTNYTILELNGESLLK